MDSAPDPKGTAVPLKHLRDLFALAPAHNDHHVALRCGVGVGVPLLLLLVLGRVDLAIFATFGAFTGIYGRNEPHRARLGHQLRAGALMLLVVTAAVASARLHPDAWDIVAGTSLVAGLASLAAGLWRLRPAGSLFHIFAYGAIASMPAHPPAWQALLTAVCTVVFALMLGQLGMLSRRHRTGWQRPARPRFSPAQRRALAADAGLHLLAAAVAGCIATALGIGHNYWAMVAATVPLVGQTVRSRMFRGVQRVLGTFAGLLVTALILWPGLEPWQMAVVIALLQFAAEMFVLRQYALAQVFVTPLALVSTELARPSDPAVLLQDRAVETVIGAAVGMAVVLALHWRATVLRRRGQAAGAQAEAGQGSAAPRGVASRA